MVKFWICIKAKMERKGFPDGLDVGLRKSI